MPPIGSGGTPASPRSRRDATLGSGTLGYEWDGYQPGVRRDYPAGRIDLSQTNAAGATHHLSLYRQPGGGLVFGAGTVQWSWGLDGNARPRRRPPRTRAMQQATVNLLSDMGAQPATLQSGLVAGGALDTTAPTVDDHRSGGWRHRPGRQRHDLGNGRRPRRRRRRGRGFDRRRRRPGTARPARRPGPTRSTRPNGPVTAQARADRRRGQHRRRRPA